MNILLKLLSLILFSKSVLCMNISLENAKSIEMLRPKFSNFFELNFDEQRKIIEYTLKQELNDDAVILSLKELQHKVVCLLSLSVPKVIKKQDVGRGILISGSEDKIIRVWDANTGELIKKLKGHRSAVLCLENMGDGLFASGSWDKTIKIWNSFSGQELHTLSGHGHVVQCLAYLGEDIIASGSWDNTIRIWDIKAENCLRVLQGHDSWVTCLVKLQKNIIASGSDDNNIKIWDVASGECLHVLRGHAEPIKNLIYLNNNILISGSEDNTIKIWNVSSGELIKTLKGHTKRIKSLIDLKNNTIASASDDRSIRIWNILTGECLNEIDSKTKDVCALSNLDLINDQVVWKKIIILGCNVNSIKLWNLHNLEYIINKYFNIENPLVLRLCLLDGPLNESEKIKIKKLFSKSDIFNKSKLNDWIDSIHSDFIEIVRTKLFSIR